jgi:hypothetical protein
MLFSYSTVLAVSLLLLNSPVLSKKAKKNKPSKAFCTAGEELLPNLACNGAFDLTFYTSSGQAGRLRFATLSDNTPPTSAPITPVLGPLEIFGGTDSGDIVNNTQKVYQRVYYCNSDGTGTELLDDSSSKRFVGYYTYHSTHGHVHFDDYATYVATEQCDGAEEKGQKVSFCLLDTDKIDGSLPGAPKRSHYNQCSSTTQGISVGWGDKYSAGLDDQWVDLGNEYVGVASCWELCIDVNFKQEMKETDYSDNECCIYVSISAAGNAQKVDSCDCTPD